jgi:hypothetical protein
MPSFMANELYALAKDADLESVCQAAAEACEDEDEAAGEVYQWMQVAAALGRQEADEIADDIYEAVLSRWGDETVAVLHMEVAEWFVNGDHGVEVNTSHAVDQLECAENLQLRDSVEVDSELLAIRSKLSGQDLGRFDSIFPGLT